MLLNNAVCLAGAGAMHTPYNDKTLSGMSYPCAKVIKMIIASCVPGYVVVRMLHYGRQVEET